MTKQSSSGAAFWLSFVAAFAVGVAIEIGLTGNRREAWDSPSYWSVGLPLMILGALACGFFARRRQIAVGYAPFFGQLVAMLGKPGAGSMLPMGAIFMGALGLTGVAAAFVGAFVRKWAFGTQNR